MSGARFLDSNEGRSIEWLQLVLLLYVSWAAFNDDEYSR
jgi:hypothetical protein